MVQTFLRRPGMVAIAKPKTARLYSRPIRR
jgi:hypothetical protein